MMAENKTRSISEMTAQEGAGLWDAIMPVRHCPFRGSAYKYSADEQAPERVVFMSGVERMGVYFNGHIWADSDMIPIELDKQKILEYLANINITT